MERARGLCGTGLEPLWNTPRALVKHDRGLCGTETLWNGAGAFVERARGFCGTGPMPCGPLCGRAPGPLSNEPGAFVERVQGMRVERGSCETQSEAAPGLRRRRSTQVSAWQRTPRLAEYFSDLCVPSELNLADFDSRRFERHAAAELKSNLLNESHRDAGHATAFSLAAGAAANKLGVSPGPTPAPVGGADYRRSTARPRYSDADSRGDNGADVGRYRDDTAPRPWVTKSLTPFEGVITYPTEGRERSETDLSDARGTCWSIASSGKRS